MKLSHFAFIVFVSTLLLSCIRTEKIKDGYTAYERKRYAEAISFFEREYERASNQDDQIRISYFTGKSYEMIGEYREAASWFKKGYENGCGDRCLEHFAQMMKNLQQYDQAILAYQRLAQTGNRAEYQRKIAECQNAILWQSKPRALELEGVSYNTPTTEYPTQLNEFGDLIISYDGRPEGEEDKYYWTGNSFFDMREVNTKNGNEETLEPYYEFEGNQADLVVYDNIAFFTRCYANDDEYHDYCKLMVCYKDGNFWSRPEALPFVKSGLNYGGPSFDPVDQVLYFSANLEQDSADVNIYQVVYAGDRTWNEPSLVPNANTTGREVFPRIYGDTLYFSSDARGMGGLDIFYVHKSLGRWSAPHNLRAPINSGGDDFALTINQQSDDETLGYFASSRRGGKGKDDIYSFKKVELFPKKGKEVEEAGFDTVNVRIIVQQRVYNIPDQISSGVKYREPLPDVSLEVQAFPGINLDTITDEFGNFELQMIANNSISVRAAKEGYLSNTLNALVGTNDTSFSMVLDKILYDQEIVLDNIYFDFDKWDIRADAEPALNDLVQLLNDNPELNIEMSSHTDCRGTVGFNQDLSQKRAFSTVQYLVQNGISQDRLRARGYGEAQPRTTCDCDDCSEQEHQLNRRTAFKILKN